MFPATAIPYALTTPIPDRTYTERFCFHSRQAKYTKTLHATLLSSALCFALVVPSATEVVSYTIPPPPTPREKRNLLFFFKMFSLLLYVHTHLQGIVSEWGDDVTCATPQTSPLYGFFINGLSVLLFFGGGIISFYMTYTAERDLGEAVEMWKNDRAEMAEMASRRAMVEKKEQYVARAASAANSAALTPVSIFKKKSAASASASASSSPATVTAKEEEEDEEEENVALSSIDLHSGDEEGGENGTTTDKASVVPARRSVLPSILESPRRQKSSLGQEEGVDWDLESGSEAAAAGGTADDTSKGVVIDKDLPPPEGWEVRSTPSGDK